MEEELARRKKIKTRRPRRSEEPMEQALPRHLKTPSKQKIRGRNFQEGRQNEKLGDEGTGEL